MSFDDQIRDALERATAALRAQLEHEFSTYSEELRQSALAERERAAREAAEAASEEMRRRADAEIANLRDLAHRDVEELKRSADEEKNRAVQQAAESAATAVRRDAEAHITKLQEQARRQFEEQQRSADEERQRASRQAAETAAADVRQQADAQIAELQKQTRQQIEELSRQAAAERDRAVREAVEAATAEVRREADARIAALHQAAEQQAKEMTRASEARIEEVSSSLQTQLNDAMQAATAQSEETKSTFKAELEEARRAAATELDELRRGAEERLGEAHRELDVQREAVRQARADLERARNDIEEAHTIADAALNGARAEAERKLDAQLAAAHAESEKKIEEAVARARVAGRQAELAQTDLLVAAIRTLDDTTSLGETLDALAECAARQVERAAVLVVKGERLRARRLAGFAGAKAVEIDLDIDAAGLAGAVVRTGVNVTRPTADPAEDQGTRQLALPPFAREAGVRHAAALPILVGGHVVAVLYADAPPADRSMARAWPALLEVLTRHASHVLEVMTVQQATGLVLPRPSRRPAASAPNGAEHGANGDEDSARRYARLLVSEIRMYHQPLVDEGRRSRDLRSRLGGEIDRARRLYEARVPPAVRERSDYFEQELVRTLADGDRSLLG